MSRSRYQPSRVFAVLLLLLLASSGCSRNTSLRSYFRNGLRVGPQYRTPGAELEPQWIDMQSDPRLVGESADLSRWWTALNDPVLDELMAAAYDRNLPIRQAAYRIRQAESVRAIAVGSFFPQSQQAVGDFSRIQASRNVALPLPKPRFNDLGVGFQAGWELDFWGRFRRSIEAADATLGASVADYDNVAVLLLANVASTYVEIRTLQQQLQLVRTVITLQKGSLDLAQTLFNAGKTNELDVIQARNNVAITLAAIPRFQAALRSANNRLCILLGTPPRDLVAELPPAPIPTVSRDVQVGFPADLLRRRPDIRRAERLLGAQSERIGIAETALYPQITLLGSFEWRAENLTDLFNPRSVTALIRPGFAWNILNYGRLVNGIRLEEARFQEAVLAYQQTVLVAQQEVEDSMIGFLKAQEEADRLAIAVSEVNASEAIARTLYETGKIDFNRVFLIQSLQFSQQVDLVTSRASAVLNLIAIYRALGGGWEIRYPDGGQGVPLKNIVSSRPIGDIPAIDRPSMLPPPLPDAGPTAPSEPGTPEPTSGDRERLRELLERLQLDQRERDNRDVDSQLKELLRRGDQPEPPR